jgi:hypothetical protein
MNIDGSYMIFGELMWDNCGEILGAKVSKVSTLLISK